MSNGRGIYRAYHQAGQDFLAYRLGNLFVKIETPADIALHNDVLDEVMEIIRGEEQSFFKDIAHIILYVKEEPRKRLLFRIAGKILEIGQKKG